MSKRLQSLFDNARTLTFSHSDSNGKVKVVVREGLGLDRLDGQVYRRYLREQWHKEYDDPKAKTPALIPDDVFNRMINFVGFMARTVSLNGKYELIVQQKKVNLFLPDKNDPTSWYESFWVFCHIPGGLMSPWDDALDKVNKPSPPPEAPPDDDKNTTNT